MCRFDGNQSMKQVVHTLFLHAGIFGCHCRKHDYINSVSSSNAEDAYIYCFSLAIIYNACSYVTRGMHSIVGRA